VWLFYKSLYQKVFNQKIQGYIIHIIFELCKFILYLQENKKKFCIMKIIIYILVLDFNYIGESRE
jgi:hypothetical protein